MKFKDSDLIQEYNATKRLGNPDTAASGDAKQLRKNMHDTNNAKPTVNFWDGPVKEILTEIKEMDFKSTGYKRMVDSFVEVFAVAEDMFNEEEICKGFLDALEEQRDFYRTKEKFYSNLRTTLKFKLNER
jgi:hypothetical protein